MRPESFDDMVAEQCAQQQVILITLRRVATLCREANIDPIETAEHWKAMGSAAIDQVDFRVAPGHEPVVRDKEKARMTAIIELGLRESLPGTGRRSEPARRRGSAAAALLAFRPRRTPPALPRDPDGAASVARLLSLPSR